MFNMGMRFRLFGPLEAETDSGPVDLGPPKQRAVLTILLLHANEVVATDRFVDYVWGENPPKTADHSVQIYVSDLRKALPDEVIETKSPGYALTVSPEAVDILSFQRLAGEGLLSVKAGDPDTGIPLLEQALGLWSGDPLHEFEYQEFARRHIRILNETRSDVIEALADWFMAEGDYRRVRAHCRTLIEEEPLREEPRRLMMLALYRSGRQADALKEYSGFRSVLADELGIEPSDALKGLEERILLQDPELMEPSFEPVADGNPYRGLRPFGENDADVYFGREDLIEDLVDRVRRGVRLVSIVGPSGSGKSSALLAGLTPRLKSDGHRVTYMQPGARPLWELAGAIEHLGFGDREDLLRRIEDNPRVLATLIDRPVVLMVDQFEELFTLSDGDVASRFADLVSAAVTDEACGLSLVCALRADYFDRPLSMPALAPLFAKSTVTVSPISAVGLEKAIVEPARMVGRAVERDLLAELTSDMRDQPGALPLLQFTLFDLYERSDGDLTSAAYAEMGGLHGALASSADEILERLNPRERGLAEQLFLRLVRKSRYSSAANPATIRTVLDLGEPLDLRRVLEAFGERRLLTFSRDASGNAIVQIAHEYLIEAWPQLGDWIATHADDLDMLSTLVAAVEEWEENKRSEDFLFRGDRLERTSNWRDDTSLRLATAEAAFVDASIDVRDRPPPPPDVVAVFENRGDGAFCDLIGAGIDRAVAEHGVDVLEHTGRGAHVEGVEEAIERGTRLVLIDAFELTNRALLDVVHRHPEVMFVLMGSAPVDVSTVQLENLKRLNVASEEMGFLAGVVAALASSSGKVGYMAGVDLPAMHEFQAGYEQGVACVDPGYSIESVYLTGGRELMDVSAFNSVALGTAGAAYLRRLGVDVIFAAAGGSGWGLFSWAAKHLENTGERVRTIGVDIDQAKQVEVVKDQWGLDPAYFDAMRELMLTSVLWRLDLAIDRTIATYLAGDPVEGLTANIGNGGVDYVATSKLPEAWRRRLDRLMEDVRDGSLVVSAEPKGPVKLLLDELAK